RFQSTVIRPYSKLPSSTVSSMDKRFGPFVSAPSRRGCRVTLRSFGGSALPIWADKGISIQSGFPAHDRAWCHRDETTATLPGSQPDPMTPTLVYLLLIGLLLGV